MKRLTIVLLIVLVPLVCSAADYPKAQLDQFEARTRQSLTGFIALKHHAAALLAHARRLAASDPGEIEWAAFVRDVVEPWYEAEAAWKEKLDFGPKHTELVSYQGSNAQRLAEQKAIPIDLEATESFLYDAVAEAATRCNTANANLYLRGADEGEHRARLELAGKDVDNLDMPYADKITSLSDPLKESASRCGW